MAAELVTERGRGRYRDVARDAAAASPGQKSKAKKKRRAVFGNWAPLIPANSFGKRVVCWSGGEWMSERAGYVCVCVSVCVHECVNRMCMSSGTTRKGGDRARTRTGRERERRRERRRERTHSCPQNEGIANPTGGMGEGGWSVPEPSFRDPELVPKLHEQAHKNRDRRDKDVP